MTDIERVTKLAQQYTDNIQWHRYSDGIVSATFTPEQLLAFEKAVLAERDSNTCDQCNGDGWNYNRVEGQVACVCMTEAEPYQKLQTEIEQLQEKLAMQADSMEWLWSMVENTTDNERERYQSALSAAKSDVDAFMQGKNTNLRARVAQLEEALREVLDRVVRLNEAEPDKRIAYNECMRIGNAALSTQPSDYRCQIVDETIEKVVSRLEQVQEYKAANETRKLKGTL